MIWLWLGCGSAAPQPSEAALYTQALSGAGLDTEERLALCARLQKPDRQAECIAGVVHASALPEDTRCDRIPAGRWRDECWFKLAERRGPRLSPEDAAAACVRAGDYMRPCVGHVLSHHVQQLHTTGPEPEQVDALAAEWADALGTPAAVSDTWRFYWELEQRDAPDPTRCATAPCMQALAANHRAALRQLIRADPRTGCDHSASRAALLASWRSPPAEGALLALLEDVERHVHQELCQ